MITNVDACTYPFARQASRMGRELWRGDACQGSTFAGATLAIRHHMLHSPDVHGTYLRLTGIMGETSSRVRLDP